ncbi:MAG: copper oxidase [Hydrogenimonas sp.]|nr:MAG: copper oxidase [Hydrogenimonas sp.]
MNRRSFLTLSLYTSALLLSGCGTSSRVSVTELKPIKNRQLPIPPLLDPTPDDQGVKHFNLTIQKSFHTFFDGVQTTTYGINESSYLGPTLLMKNGDRVKINYTNHLDETITMHGHGMHVPAQMDGGPHQPILPNATWSAEYRVKQNASTNWYHPHFMGKTAEQVYYGLAGLIIVEDKESSQLNIPHNYGIDDIPLVLQDRRFNANGALDYSPSRREIMHGYQSDIFLVNGAIEPTFTAQAGWLRLRLLNGSNAGVYEVGFHNERLFYQIASDNSLLEKPVPLTSVRLSPGERAEIIVDLSNDAGNTLILKELNHQKDLLTINVSTAFGATYTLPNQLTTLVKEDPATAVRTRQFTLGMQRGTFTINGQSMDINVINEYVPIDQVEIWEITNSMMMPHNFHIHATHFLILERDGSAANVLENEKGYKDTVYLPPNSRVKVIVRMRDYADAQAPYMYHCHFLEHEDHGMMGQFVVTP